MIPIEELIQSNMQHIKTGIDMLQRQQNFFNDIAYCSIVALGLITLGMTIFMYKKCKRQIPNEVKQ